MALRLTITAILAAVGCAGNQQNAVVFSGPGQYEKDQEYLAEADTVSEKQVPFDLWYPNGKDAPRWQLDVRLDVGPVPDSDIPDAQRLNTVYDFVLPGGQNLVEAVAANSVHLDQKNFCVTILETPLPYNEAKRYNPKKEENASDWSCGSVFERECMKTLSRLARETKPGPDGCSLSHVEFSNIKQCEWIFIKGTRTPTFNLLKPGLDLSGGFAHITSDVYEGSNSTLIDIAEERIHMVAIESGSTFTPLCVRIADKKEK